MDYQVKVCKFPTVFIVTAFIMLHPKISIIMVESNLRPQMDPSMMTTWSSSNNGPPVYGQMFDNSDQMSNLVDKEVDQVAYNVLDHVTGQEMNMNTFVEQFLKPVFMTLNLR